MSRPQGEVRTALAAAAAALHAEQGGATWRELAQRACVGLALARVTVGNMRRAGELVTVGARIVPGTRRQMAVFAPAAAVPADQAPAGMAAVHAALQAWGAAAHAGSGADAED